MIARETKSAVPHLQRLKPAKASQALFAPQHSKSREQRGNHANANGNHNGKPKNIEHRVNENLSHCEFPFLCLNASLLAQFRAQRKLFQRFPVFVLDSFQNFFPSRLAHDGLGLRERNETSLIVIVISSLFILILSSQSKSANAEPLCLYIFACARKTQLAFRRR